MTSNPSREWLINDVGMKQESVDEACRQILRFSRNESAFRGSARIASGYMGTGNRKAEVMIVSGIPTDSEKNSRMVALADYAIPLTLIFNKLGMNFNDLYWTLAFKSDERPTYDAIIKQRRHIQDEVISVNPSLIISLGNTAITSLLAKRTKWDEVEEGIGYNVIDNLPDVPIIALGSPTQIIEARDVEVFREFFKTTWSAIKDSFD